MKTITTTTSALLREKAEKLMLHLILKTSVPSILIDQYFDHLFSLFGDTSEDNVKSFVSDQIKAFVVGRPKVTLKRLHYFKRISSASKIGDSHIAILEKLLLSQPVEVPLLLFLSTSKG